MNIVFCSDINYLKLFPTVLNSISSSNDINGMKFHLLHNIEDSKLVKYYEKYIDKKFDIKLISHFISKKFKYSSNLNHVTDATMLRLLIPDVIEVNEKAIYFDLDVIVNTDLRKLLKTNISNKGISGKTSLHTNVIEDMTFNKIKPPYKTLNAGVLIMDLNILRKNQFTKKCLKILERYPYNDQVIINLYLEGDYVELPEQYNIFNTQDDKLLLKYDKYILHYVSASKPWNHKALNSNIWKKFEVFI